MNIFVRIDRGFTRTFLSKNSFESPKCRYLDQLGMAAVHNTRVYCRQTLIGGFYGLLNKTTFVPTPDYYSALLWHRLMGDGVLSVDSNASPFLRVYAHCAKDRVREPFTHSDVPFPYMFVARSPLNKLLRFSPV